jgi:hypothetical protein
MSDDDHVGYGFTIKDDEGQIRVSIAFASEVEAKEAERKVRAILDSALFVAGPRDCSQ